MYYRTFILAILLTVSGVAAAEQRWVTDEFEVMLRSGKSTRQSIVRQLKSGTPVELLEADAASGYSRVRTSSGAEGWVLSRYLRSVPTAGQLLPDLELKLTDSEAARRQLAQELDQLRGLRRQLEGEVGELQSANASQQSQLDRITRLSASTIEVDEQNAQLRERLAESEDRLEALEADNQRLASRANREWFLLGGAVLAAGLLLGLILPRISWRKKSSWSDV